MTQWPSVLLLVAALLPGVAQSEDADQLLIEDECRKLGIRYAHYIDLAEANRATLLSGPATPGGEVCPL